MLLAMIMAFGLAPAPVFAEDSASYSEYNSYSVESGLDAEPEIDDALYTEDDGQDLPKSEPQMSPAPDIPVDAPELEIQVIRDSLIVIIAEAQSRNQDDYTADSWADLQLAILLAIIVLEDENATQDAVDKAISDLYEVINSLIAYESADTPIGVITQMTGIVSFGVPIGQVFVMISDDVDYPSARGLMRYGWVNLYPGDCMRTSIQRLADDQGFNVAGWDFISEIDGLGTGVRVSWDGWMGTLNDWFTNAGFSTFNESDGNLMDGDIIDIRFSMEMGVDIGGSWDSNNKTLMDLRVTDGAVLPATAGGSINNFTLNPSFSANITAYTLTLPAGIDYIWITPTAFNKNFLVRTFEGGYIGGTEHRRTHGIPVVDGMVIEVGVGETGWPSMNNQAGGTGDSYPGIWYTITVEVSGGGSVGTVDKSVLLSRIAYAEALEWVYFTAASWTALTTSLNAAVLVNADANATHQDVNNAEQDLFSRIATLVSAHPMRTALGRLIREAEEKTEPNYTSASWAALQTSLSMSRNMFVNGPDNPQILGNGAAGLTNAINNLVPIAEIAALEVLIAQAQDRTENNYTVTTWATLQTALNSAITVRDSLTHTRSQVTTATSGLTAAIASLEAAAPADWPGQGTAASPYLISNADELMLLATRVNEAPNAAQKTGVHFRLTNDIDLNDLNYIWPSIGQADIRTTWVNPNAHQGSSFDGIFDGNGHTVTFAHGSPPLFGAVQGNAQIRNLNIFGPYIAGHGLIAGVSAQQAFGSASYIPIENVTVLSGTTIRGSGFAGTDGFRPQQLAISNSTIETGVRIGFDAEAGVPFDQNLVYFANTAGTGPGVGSFVSSLAGSITNSVSYATVYGHPNVVNVGGLVGYKQQSMRTFEIINSQFHGEIIAPNSRHVGGILGAGYDSPNPRNNTPSQQLGGFTAAPNTPGGNIHNSTVTGNIIGYQNVGGIVGGEFANQMWSTGSTRQGPQHVVVNNHFEGTLTATASGTRNVGAIFGYVRSLNRNNIIVGNTFIANGSVDRGIGYVSVVDTIHTNPTPIGNTIYFSTQGTAAQNPNTTGLSGITRRNYYRIDDPLGADLETLVKEIGGGNVIIVDKAALRAAIVAAQGHSESDYTPATWTSMQTALIASQIVYADAGATQLEVDESRDILNAAINALVERANKSALAAAIADANGRNEASYVPASWANMQSMLVAAGLVNANLNAAQAEVNTAAGNLNTALTALVRINDTVNMTVLSAAISEAQSRMPSNYTSASWMAMQTQLSAAIAVRNNTAATQTEVNNAASSLNAAINALVPESIPVNLTALNSEITRAESRSQSNYTPSSWEAMQTQLTTARSVRDNSSSTQSQVDAATDSLRAAIYALVARANLTALNTAIAAAQGRTQANYTAASWAAMQTALTAARNMRDNANATQAQVDTAANALVNATANLAPVPSGARVWLTVQNPNARPGDPTIFFPGRYIDIAPGETAYSILRRADVGLSIQSTGHHTWDGMYVQSINGWGEFDGGPLSGWMYAVNRVFPGFSASLYELQDGDRLYWLYTYELGQDLTRFGAGSTFGGVNRGPLRAAIERAEARVQANYTPASWTPFQAALAAAIRERDRGAAEQHDIDRVLRELNAAEAGLVSISTANRSALEAIVARVQAMTATNYTAASWTRVQTHLAAAITVRDNTTATQNQIDAAVRSLQSAIDALVEIGAVNLAALNQEIAQAEGRVQANYTAASWSAMQTALTEARNMRNNTNATQAQVNTAASNLRSALNGLVTISGVNVVALSNEIARAEARNQSNYTVTSWAVMQNALSTARQVRNNVNATQTQVDQATTSLTSAINTLVRDTGPAAPLGAAPAPEIIVISVIREVEVIVTEDGTAIATVGNEIIRNLIAQAREERATNITINIPITQAVSRIEAELAALSIREIAADGLSLTMQSDMATINLDDATLAGLALGAADDDTIRIVVVAMGNSHYRLVAMIGDQYVSNFNGRVTVTIPYSPSIPAEDHDLLTIYHLNGESNFREMIGAHYANSHMTFTTNHFSVFFVSEWISPFADVARHDWYFRNVRFAYSSGLMSGTGNGEFAPNTNLSRGMIVTMLWRLEGMPVVSYGNTFHDVQFGNWYADAIAWASANGIVNGYGNGMFGPNDNVTREQIAMILQNYAQFRGKNVFGGMLAAEFTDASSISPWAQEAMEWANMNGFITGRTMTTLAPNGTATRAEFATILQRFIEAR